jgi:SynChlorMet cassette radical SAM/SPASM protein ScmF
MSCTDIPVQAENRPAIALDLPQGVPPLTSLYVYASGSCNLACRHCWIAPTYQGSGGNGRHVNLNYVRKAIREARPLGLQCVKLTGGEPTLHPQFRELVTLIGAAGPSIIIETNGTLIDADLAAFLRRESHVSFISVSVDGATAETHDALRGVPGSYDRAINGIRALVEVGFRPQLICSVHEGNVSQMAEVVALAEELGCGSAKFNYIQALGRGKQFFEEHGLGVAEVIQTYHSTEAELASRSQIPIFSNVPFAFYSVSKLLSERLGRCMVTSILGMLSDGTLALCGIGVHVPELAYGHVEKDNLRDLWCYSPGLVRLREQIPAQLTGVCEQCAHRDHCLGSCVAYNFHETGRLNAPHQFCDRAEALGLFPASRKIRLQGSSSRCTPYATGITRKEVELSKQLR